MEASPQPIPKKSKLISRLQLTSTSVCRNDTRTTNFAKYSPMPSLQSRRSFPKTPNQRFKKHCNLVETNKQNIMRLRTHFDQLTKRRKNLQQRKIETHTPFEPKRRCQMGSNQFVFDSPPVNLQMSSKNLQQLLRKNSMKSSRNLLGLNILALERKFNLSRFELHNLYSTYKTLLFDSKNSMRRFRYSLQVILNIQKVTIRPDVLDKLLFEQQTIISFECFVEMYKKIEQTIYKQNIIDYVQTLFDSVYDKNKIRFQDITRVFKYRITDKESYDIAAIIFEQNCKKFDDNITLTQIVDLCRCCENFSKIIYRIYTKDTKLD